MVAILLWEISGLKLNEQLMTGQDQRALFGRTFEKLGQERRIQVLRACRQIDEQACASFDTIRNTRRKYLHLWSQDHDSLPKDAIRTFHEAVRLVTTAIGQDFQDGKVVLNSKLVKYLERSGVYEPA